MNTRKLISKFRALDKKGKFKLATLSIIGQFAEKLDESLAKNAFNNNCLPKQLTVLVAKGVILPTHQGNGYVYSAVSVKSQLIDLGFAEPPKTGEENQNLYQKVRQAMQRVAKELEIPWDKCNAGMVVVPKKI